MTHVPGPNNIRRANMSWWVFEWRSIPTSLKKPALSDSILTLYVILGQRLTLNSVYAFVNHRSIALDRSVIAALTCMNPDGCPCYHRNAFSHIFANRANLKIRSKPIPQGSNSKGYPHGKIGYFMLSMQQ